MPKETAQRRLMDEQDLIRWREATMTALPDKERVHAASDASDHSDHISFARQTLTDFHKSTIQLPKDRKHSLLTKALQPSHEEDGNPQIYVATDMARHRSTRSNTSTASTAELTSDGGLTSPDRASTPSPPFPTATYMSFVPYTLGPKLSQAAFARTQQAKNSVTQQQPEAPPMPKPDPAVEALVKKRCVSFACGGQRPKEVVKPTSTVNVENNNGPSSTISPPKRTIKFACQAPKPERQGVTLPQPPKVPQPTVVPASPPKPVERQNTRSPSMTRKLRPPPSPQSKSHRDSTSTVRRASQSPAAFRSRKPKYIVADEEALESSEATRFHEFASDEPQEDDWIRKDASYTKTKLTINDTLKKENAIRQLGKEAEEEALEDEDDDSDEGNDDSDDEDEDIEDDDDNTVDGSDVDLDASDGNETDNEAGFADSDDESDPTGEYQFWTPRKSLIANSGEVNIFRSSSRRASESSIDSLSHMSPIMEAKGVRSGRMKPSRKIRIRPGTPDLPDSTDFVCGTLDEDRPLEDAYVSCMEARRREKHHIIPQDIDPSFPTSEPEDEEDETDEVEQTHDSDEEVWFHGKFEDSDSETRRHRRRKSPKQSPKRLHSPPPPTKHRSPPATTRYRSPPPRPKHARSPPPTRIIYSPPTSPANLRDAVIFAPLGNRPGLTHTKSLPRRPNGFSQQYRAARLAAANMIDDNDNTDGYTRGAIDIVKGLEQKRQRRKDKFFSKLCNRARKGQQVERRPQPGKGAERMRELGLQMAGKTAADYKNGKAEYVLSV